MQAVRGWLTPEKRDAMLKKVWETAEAAVDSGDLKAFTALCNLLEKTYQFDTKLMERVEKHRATVAAKTIVIEPVSPHNLEQQRQIILSRIEAAGG